MDGCYISIGLINYNPECAWIATLIVFCVGITIGFIADLNNKNFAAVFISSIGLAFLCLFTLMLFGMKINLC